jgi:hypothetical protein
MVNVKFAAATRTRPAVTDSAITPELSSVVKILAMAIHVTLTMNVVTATVATGENVSLVVQASVKHIALRAGDAKMVYVLRTVLWG